MLPFNWHKRLCGSFIHLHCYSYIFSLHDHECIDLFCFVKWGISKWVQKKIEGQMFFQPNAFLQAHEINCRQAWHRSSNWSSPKWLASTIEQLNWYFEWEVNMPWYQLLKDLHKKCRNKTISGKCFFWWPMAFLQAKLFSKKAVDWNLSSCQSQGDGGQSRTTIPQI